MDKTEITATLDKLAACTIWHPDFERAKCLVMKSIATTAERNDPSSALLTGSSGVGKTRLCKIIERDLGTIYLHDSEACLKFIRPCIYVEVPADTNIKRMAINILKEIHKTAEEITFQHTEEQEQARDKELDRMSMARIETMIIRRLQTLETKLLILDEFHHVADRGQEATKLAICNWLTRLLNESRIAILISGSMKINTIVNSVSELSSRYPYRAILKELAYYENAEAPIFLSILAGLEREMIQLGNLVNYVHLTDPKLYKAVFLATNGNFRSLSNLLNNSFKNSLQRDDKTLLLSDFIEACNDLHFSQLQGNPFEMSATQLNSVLSAQLRVKK
ncbi:TniB family NTP-binding protein [Pseudomonas fluorescens]|uniref:TniB family NTP-binding protein n=1 Tax=Pseudomonas fluorescens TaxID=294 RepID=UPI001A9DD090|nr:TniB family NTP-binding protein [Pseudomonas fluorescens]QTD31737.1 TniB family NTP-binding protein [Pseudomonas fluorescens]